MYRVIEADIREGLIVPYPAEKIPKSGKVLVLIPHEEKSKPDLEEIRNLLGWLRTDIDAAEWQKSVRNEWEDRI
jgi:hypothetical protein